MLTSLINTLVALTAALKAFPVWLAWQMASELNSLDDEILTANAAPHVNRVKLLQLEARHARTSRLYALLCPSEAPTQSRATLHPSNR